MVMSPLAICYGLSFFPGWVGSAQSCGVFLMGAPAPDGSVLLASGSRCGTLLFTFEHGKQVAPALQGIKANLRLTVLVEILADLGKKHCAVLWVCFIRYGVLGKNTADTMLSVLTEAIWIEGGTGEAMHTGNVKVDLVETVLIVAKLVEAGSGETMNTIHVKVMMVEAGAGILVDAILVEASRI